MSKGQRRARTPDEKPHAVDRRSMMERSAAALAVAICGGLTGANLVGAQAPPPSPAGQRNAQGAAPRVRRVVTGHNAQDKSYVVSDEMVDPNDVWTTSGPAPLGAARSGEAAVLPTNRPEIDPPAGGTRLRLVTFQPARDPKPSLENRIGFHRTATIDYLYVLSGEVTCLLDEQEVTLKTGDVIVQRNTSHSWRNDGQVPARLVAILVRVDT